MRTIRPIALVSLLTVCALSLAQEPLPKLAPRLTLTVEQQLAMLQQQVAQLQTQVGALQSALQVSQGVVRLQGTSVSIMSTGPMELRADQNMDLRVGGYLTANVQANTRLRSSGMTTVEAAGTLQLKGASITQN